MINFWNDRLKVLKNIRSGRLLSKDKARHKKSVQCPLCQSYVSEEDLEINSYICRCGRYFPMPAKARVKDILDPGYVMIPLKARFNNRIDYPGYEKKYLQAQKATGLDEALVIAEGNIFGHPVVMFVMEREFLMGSMGMETGKCIVQGINLAKRKNLPLISFSVSGGARMQEGIYSLMQMANTVNALSDFIKEGLYISVYTDPTMGGVSASFASLGDIILAEKGARVGFSGPRVIEKTLNMTLPEGFQSDQSLLQHGFVDAIVSRESLKPYLGKILAYHEVENVD